MPGKAPGYGSLDLGASFLRQYSFCARTGFKGSRGELHMRRCMLRFGVRERDRGPISGPADPPALAMPPVDGDAQDETERARSWP